MLGENGAGKTVLANILSGFYSLTEGQIYVRGKPVSIKSPSDALKMGIGMVHQEFTCARPLTVAENIALGLSQSNFSFPLSEVERKVKKLSERYGLKVDPKARIEELSVGAQQRVEILKVIYYEPQVLILDEPTSLLSEQEAKSLFFILQRMAEEGHGIVFITHKLDEVFEVSDRVTVLKLREKYDWDPCRIERYIRKVEPKGVRPISHNSVYQILVEEGVNRPIDFTRKTWGKRRFERMRSNSLWQADFKLMPNDNWMLTFWTASRHRVFIPSGGVLQGLSRVSATIKR